MSTGTLLAIIIPVAVVVAALAVAVALTLHSRRLRERFGPEYEDVPGAVARMAGYVEMVGRAEGVEFPLQMTIAVSDGEQLWTFRYSSEGASRSLYYSNRVETLRALHPDVEFLQDVSEGTRLVVSEPLGGLPGAWNAVPENSYSVVHVGELDLHPFAPQPVG